MTDEFREHRLQTILHAYLQALDRGEKPDRQAILDAHPDLRDELAEYFADASKLDQLAQSLQTTSFGSGTSSAMKLPLIPATAKNSKGSGRLILVGKTSTCE